MANRTFATIKIATKEEVDNTFIIDLFESVRSKGAFRIKGYMWDEDRNFVIVDYIPSLDFDIYDLVEEISKHFPYTFSTIGHSYENMQPKTVEYIVVYKDGEVIFEEKYPLVVFEGEGEMNDDGSCPIDEEATKTIQNKLEADKKEWFPTFYQSPDKQELEKEEITKLTEKEKQLLSSAIEYLCLTGFCDFGGEEGYEELSEEEFEKRSAKKLKIIHDKILGKDYSYNGSKKEENAE